MAALDDAERFEPDTLADWGRWLEDNHDRDEGVWLVTHKKSSPDWSEEFQRAVPEALRFGWIDSVPRKLDENRTMLYFAPRKPGSNWSDLNKRYVEELQSEGRMEPAGIAAVEAAQADGSWSPLDDVENLVVPDDLAAAFDEHPGSREHWEDFPPSARRGILEWILNARRPATRTKRLQETARLAAENKRANEWPRS